MTAQLLRFDRAVERDPAIDAWIKEREGELGSIVRERFEVCENAG
jgi:hypothetical protein